MEKEGSLPCSQDPDTDRYNYTLDKTNLHEAHFTVYSYKFYC